MSDSKPSSSVEESLANMSAQIEKLAAAFAGFRANQETLQGDHSRFTVAVNHLQLDKIGDGTSANLASHLGKSTLPDNTNAITHATKHDHKLLFPTYDGSEDPLPWLNRCDRFFHVQGTLDAGKVFLASFYMFGEASQWFSLLELNQGKPSWEEFVCLVNQCFGPPLCSNPLGELIHLRREGMVVEFQGKFLSLLTRYDGLAEKHQINIFTTRLGNPLKTNVELEHPASLEEAIPLARAYKQRLSMTGLSPACPSPRSTPSYTPWAGRQLLLAPTTATPSAKDATPAPPRFKCLTAAEMVAKREKGECYNCTEQF
jgi:hypothetical protein